MRGVLADTGPLYAAFDPDDTHYEDARQELSSLARENLPVAIGFPTLLECYSLILRRFSVPRAHRWLANVSEGALLVKPVVDDFHSAVQLVQRYHDQPVTLFDAVLFTMSGRMQLPIWTYDRHFDVMHATIWRASK